MAYEEAIRYVAIYASLRDFRDRACLELRDLRGPAIPDDDDAPKPRGNYEMVQEQIMTRVRQLRVERDGMIKDIPQELRSTEPFKGLITHIAAILF